MSAAWLVRPEWLEPALAVIALLVALLALARRRSVRRARALLGRGTGDAVLRGARRSDALLVAAALALAAAGLGPRLGTRVERVLAHGVDLAIVIDGSRSMDAADVPPTRLVRARRIAADVLARLAPGDRVALVAFGDRGIVLAAPTPDLDAVAELLPAVDESLLGRRESSLAAGVRAALDAMSEAGERPRAMLLLADGEDPAGGARDDGALATALRAANVRPIVVGLGMRGGAPVPDGDRALRDDAGRPITTRADLARLATLARAAGGEAIEPDRFGRVELDALVTALRRDAGERPGEWIERTVSADRTSALGALALVLLLAELAPWTTGAALRRRIPALAPRAAATTSLALVSLLALGAAHAIAADDAPDPALAARVAALEARARSRPGDASTLLALGVTRARTARLDEAASALLGAALSAPDAKRAALAFFDLGVVQIERGDLPAARDAFFEALVRDPDDRAARANLEWTLGTLRARAAATPPPGDRAGAASPEPAPPDERARDEQSGGGGEPEPDGDARPGEAERPGDAPESATDTESDRPSSAPPTALSAEEARRLLDGVADTPGLSFRREAREGERATRARGPVW